MKKELIILNELSSLFVDGRKYKIEFYNRVDVQFGGSLFVEIDFTDDELSFVKSIIRDRIINGYGMVIDCPKLDTNFNPIPKCFKLIFILENYMKEMDLTQNFS